MDFPPGVFNGVVARFEPGCRLVRAWRLVGGASAESTALEIERPDGSRFRRVLRRHGEGDRAVNPDVAQDEHELLRVLAAEGFAAPIARGHDPSGTILPTPYILTDFVDGTNEVPPDRRAGAIDRMAEELARLHRFGPGDRRLAFLLRRDALSRREIAEARAAATDRDLETRIRTALAPHWPPPQGESVLLHGDFWPGNLLWQDDRLAAVIDWEDACFGDPLVDLGPARLELLWAWGATAKEGFTARYATLTGRPLDLLPLYDLWTALRALLRLPGWGLPAAEAAEKRNLLRGFVEQALHEPGD
jgi:aminoglycoside phosphotransferase (APT) family kinase protein